MKNLLMIMLMLPLMVISQNKETQLMTLSEFTIKQGHTAQFLDGVKKWKECYMENEGAENWNFWKRVQGDGVVYGLTGVMENWAEMDDESEDGAGQKCYGIVTNFIMPHVEKTKTGITQTVPRWSRTNTDEEMGVVWVTYMRVKDPMLFTKVVTEVNNTIAETEGEKRGYWYQFMGGDENDADYMISEVLPNYAALDEEYVNPFKAYIGIKGEKKGMEMYAQYMNSIDASWSYVWELDKELSN
jgi:hypothetical protein